MNLVNQNSFLSKSEKGTAVMELLLSFLVFGALGVVLVDLTYAVKNRKILTQAVSDAGRILSQEANLTAISRTCAPVGGGVFATSSQIERMQQAARSVLQRRSTFLENDEFCLAASSYTITGSELTHVMLTIDATYSPFLSIPISISSKVVVPIV